MLFEQAEGAIPGEVLRQIDEEHVKEDDRDESQAAGPAEKPMAGGFAPVSAPHSPTGQQAGGKDEDDTLEAGEPRDFARRKFDL